MEAARVRRALAQGELDLQFHPRVALADGRLDSIEVQLRPAALVAQAEACGLGPELGWQMVCDAVAAMQCWAGRGLLPRLWLPLPRSALAARAAMAGFARLKGVHGERLLCADAASLLRIDRRMLEQATATRSARRAFGELLGKAHAAGLASVALGVDTVLHWEMLRELGCHYAVGTLIAPAAPAHGLADALGNWRQRYAAMSAVYQYAMEGWE